MKLSLGAVALALVGCSAATPEDVASHEEALIGDVSTIARQSDGKLLVTCKNGSTELITDADVLANRVCGAGPVPTTGRALQAGEYFSRQICDLRAAPTYDGAGTLIAASFRRVNCNNTGLENRVIATTCSDGVCTETGGGQNRFTQVTEYGFIREQSGPNIEGRRLAQYGHTAAPAGDSPPPGDYRATSQQCEVTIDARVRADGTLSHIFYTPTGSCTAAKQLFLCDGQYCVQTYLTSSGQEVVDVLKEFAGETFRELEVNTVTNAVMTNAVFARKP